MKRVQGSKPSRTSAKCILGAELFSVIILGGHAYSLLFCCHKVAKMTTATTKTQTYKQKQLMQL